MVCRYSIHNRNVKYSHLQQPPTMRGLYGDTQDTLLTYELPSMYYNFVRRVTEVRGQDEVFASANKRATV